MYRVRLQWTVPWPVIPFVPPRQERLNKATVDAKRIAVLAEQAELNKSLNVANQGAPGEAGVGSRHSYTKVRQVVECHRVG